MMSNDNRLQPPVDAFRRRTPEGDVCMWLAAPNVVVQINRGDYTLALAKEVTTFYDSLWGSVADLQIFDQFEELAAYTREAREFLTEYANAHPEIGAYHLFTRSRLLALGMTAYGLQTGKPVHSYSDETAFMRALERAIARR
jgi:hypothetical protein